MGKTRSYYNNGKISKMFNIGEPIPEGWVPGMVPRSKEEKEKSNLKRKQTNMVKYGGSCPLSSETIKEKVKQTNLTKYGVENPMYLQGFKDKLKDTNNKKYGVENPFQSEEIKEKSRQTNLKNLGVEYPMQSPEIQEKRKQTTLSHYGVDHPLKSKEIQDKIKQTNLNKYGSEYAVSSNYVRNRAENTLLSNYGVTNPMFSDVIKQKQKENNLNKYGHSCTLQVDDVKIKVSNTCQERYGYPWACMRPEARKYSNDSGPNKAFAKLLNENNISYIREFHIGSYSYDFKVDNTLIEIDPTWTHNTFVGPFKNNGISVNYHQNKSNIAQECGYHCIHIFDWDDVNRVVKLLQKGNNFIYARKCVIKDVDIDECSSYLVNNHLQGYCKGQEVCIGLYYNNELVSLMTFGKPRYNKNYEYELLRYCYSANVIGGAEKLFKHFLKTYNPKSIISYCDNSKFIGKVYEKLGFTLKDRGSPSCHWYSEKEKRHITDNLLRQRGYDQLFNEHYGKGTSNEELIIQRGYLPVYDCGQSTWVYKT